MTSFVPEETEEFCILEGLQCRFGQNTAVAAIFISLSLHYITLHRNF